MSISPPHLEDIATCSWILNAIYWYDQTPDDSLCSFETECDCPNWNNARSTCIAPVLMSCSLPAASVTAKVLDTNPAMQDLYLVVVGILIAGIRHVQGSYIPLALGTMYYP